MKKAQAIKELYPNVVTINNDIAYDINGNEVEYDNTAVEAEIAKNAYKEQRVMAYKPLAEQLDMQYWDKVNGTNLWQEHIDAVKAAYPKPTE